MVIDVVVTCHAAYLKFLPECLTSIDAQALPAGKKILVYDGAETTWTQAKAMAPSGWLLVCVNVGNPNPARNTGLKECTAEWVVFFDADDLMPADYLQRCSESISTAKGNVAFVYPRILYCDDSMKPLRLMDRGPWGPFDAAHPYRVPTCSAWRREAVQGVGGWRDAQRFYDDYTLALKLTRAEWIGAAGTGFVWVRCHLPGQGVARGGQHRQSGTSEADRAKVVFDARAIGVVTLFAGRFEYLNDWADFLLRAQLPRERHLYVVDNSNNPVFSEALREKLYALETVFPNQTLLVIGKPFNGDRSSHVGYGSHVANLYNQIVPRITEELTLFLEDDVVPPLDAIPRLVREMPFNGKVGGVSGAYRSARMPAKLCGSYRGKDFRHDVGFVSMPEQPIDFHFIPGGCSLYFTPVLKKCLPFRFFADGQYVVGWDGHVSSAIRKQGWRLLMHGGVRCNHMVPAVRDYLAGNPIETLEQFPPVGYDGIKIEAHEDVNQRVREICKSNRKAIIHL